MRVAREHRWLFIGITVLLGVLAAEGLFLWMKWPFTTDRVSESLARSTASNVRIGRLDMSFFPHPGCVAYDVSFERGAHKLATAHKVTIVGSWAALLALRHYVSRIELQGAEVQVSSEMPPPEQRDGKLAQTTIGELVANGTILRFTGGEIAFNKIKLRNVSKEKAIQFDLDFTIPQPNGRVTASGSFGPWRNRETRLEGSFRLHQAKLSVVRRGRRHGFRRWKVQRSSPGDPRLRPHGHPRLSREEASGRSKDHRCRHGKRRNR